MRFAQVTVDIEHADYQAIKNIELAESKKEVHKEPVARSSSNIDSLFDTTCKRGNTKVNYAPDQDHPQKDECKSNKPAEDVNPRDSVILISIVRSFKAFLPVNCPNKL